MRRRISAEQIRGMLLGATALSLGIASFTLSGTEARANDLYFGMPINYDGGETDTLFVYGKAGITGTVTSPSGFLSSFTVGSGGVTSITIPSSYDLRTAGVVSDNGFHISTTSASDNVGASYLSRETYTTDTTYLLNSTALGTSYYGVGYPAVSGSSQLTIVGTKAGTTVNITQSGATSTFTLGAGQAYLYNSSDVTGAKVTSDAPIAVFGGSQCANVPSGVSACDHLLTALPSTNNYTTKAEIVTTKGTEGTASNIMRVLAATDGTIVKYNGSVVATLNAGEFYEGRTGAGGELTANNPILINEYLTGESEHDSTVGDPAQSFIPGNDQWLNDYILSTPVGDQAYETNFLDLAIPDSDLKSLLLDGALVTTGSLCSSLSAGFSACEIAIAAGVHEISADDPFLALVDGGTSYDSYFTFLGTTFSAGASPPPPVTGVPLPASLPMFGGAVLALGGLGYGLRRRASKAASAA